MAVEIYVVRHELPDKLVHSETARGLLPEGRRRAELLRSIGATHIFHSRVLRADQTAEIAAGGRAHLEPDSAFGDVEYAGGRHPVVHAPGMPVTNGTRLEKPNAKAMFQNLFLLGRKAQNAGSSKILVVTHEPHLNELLRFYEGEINRSGATRPARIGYGQGMKFILENGQLHFAGFYLPKAETSQ